MDFLEILKSIFLGIVEGITEWLPISSTGHMLLVDKIFTLKLSEDFKNMFFVVIQLGAIMAVVTLYFHKLNPFSPRKSHVQKHNTWVLWFKVLVACIPTILIALPFDDYIDAHLHTPLVIALMLIIYGVAFIVIESMNRRSSPTVLTVETISYKTALIIGIFQVLSVIPGTSRSGATIVGALLIGVSRSAAAEFTFFLGIPTMLGASLLKLVKFGLKSGFAITPTEIICLITGMAVAYFVSILTIRFLMNYIKKHDFKAFGWYRIALGAVVLGVMLLTKS